MAESTERNDGPDHVGPGDRQGRLQGTVVRTTGSWHDVELSREQIVPSRVPGKGRLEGQKSTNPVAVGDRVEVSLNDDGTGQIVQLLPRRNKLSRRAAGRRWGLEHVIAANVDFVWIVQSVTRPRFNAGFVDRLLVMAGIGDIPTGIIINKMDLADSGDLRRKEGFWRDLYRDLGYPVLETCAISGAGVDAFAARLAGGTSVITGPSGVGKSTLLNAVSPGLNVRTAKISEKTGKGKHTTAVAVRYEVGPETFVIDTPGIREFGLWNLEPDELYGYFYEMLDPARQCRFPNCLHDHEPGCGVRAAVKAGRVTDARFASYLNMLESLKGDDRGR